MDSLDDLFQPSTNSARPVGKFKPKSKSKPASVSSTLRPCTSAPAQKDSTPLSSDTVSVGSKEAQSCIEGNGRQQKVPELVGADGNTTSLSLESIDGILPQATTATSGLEPKAKAVPEYEKHILSSVIPEYTKSLSSQHDVRLDGSNTRVLPSIDSSFSESSAHQPADSYHEIPPAKDLESQSGAPHSEPVFSDGDGNSGRGLGCSGAESIALLDDILLQPTVTLGIQAGIPIVLDIMNYAASDNHIGAICHGFSRTMGKFQPKPHARPRNKKVVKLPNVLPEVVRPAPLPVDYQLNSPQINMSLKGSTQLSAPDVNVDLAIAMPQAPKSPAQTDPSPQFFSEHEPKSLMDDSHLEGAVTCENKDIHMDHGSLGREEHAAFSGLEAHDDSISQPTPAAVQRLDEFHPEAIVQPNETKSKTVRGLDEFYPEAIVQPNDTKSNNGLSLGTEVMQSVFSLVNTESHSPRLEQSKEIPSGASVEAFSISPLNSALVELSPQLLTSQETINSTVVLPAERFSGNDGVLQRGQQCSREEVATASASFDSDISVGLESVVDILLQPGIATGRSLSKFLPKPIDQCKSKKGIASPSVISEAAVSVSDQIEGLEESTRSIVQDSAPLEPSISMHGISAQTSSSLQPVTTQDTVDPIYIPHPETHANGDFGIDAGSSAREEAEGSPALNSINDILLEPATITSRGVGKFRPKSKSQTPTVKPFTLAVPSDDMEPISSPLKSQFLPRNECLKEASTDTFVHSVTIDSTSEHHCSQPGSQEAEDHFGLASFEAETAAVEATSEHHCSQPGSQEAEDHFVLADLEAAIAGGEGGLHNVPETSGIEGTKSRNVQVERSISTAVKENEASTRKRQRKKNNAIHTSIDEGKGVQDELHVSAAEDIEAGPTRRLRKRTKCTTVDEIEDGSYEPSNISAMEEHSDVDSDDDGRRGDKPKKKRVSKAAQKSVSETDKPVKRRRKKASEEPDTVKSEPTKKKFSHTTQRSRRRVNKALLETPEEEIDPRKLTMKDLIMLAEFRERQSTKEAAAKKSFPTSSADNSLRNDSLYDNDDPLASQDGFEPDDGPTSHRDEPVSKLNYHSFMKRTPKERWSKSDTEMFYEALRQFGTDFAMIQQLFPGRTRHQVKLKFKAEERKRPLQLSDAWVHRSKDHSHFELLIERLRSQAEQNTTRDEESLDMSVGNEEDAVGSEQNGEESKKNEQSWKEMKKDSADEIQEEKKSNLEHEVESPVKSYGSPDVYDWSQYRSADAFSPQDMEKDYSSVLLAVKGLQESDLFFWWDWSVGCTVIEE
ncbi:Transcription factor TFIIIB component B [Asimina triloba]